MLSRLLRSAGMVALVAATSTFVAPNVYAQPDPQAARAQEQSPQVIAFPLADGNTMVGYHYEGRLSQPLVLMVHGASDSNIVFDLAPGFRAARGLALSGFPVLTVDRVGYGASSHPSGDSLDFARSADYLHEVVQAVRRGALGFTPSKVVMLGISVGADVTIVEAGTYHDIDGAIVCFHTAQLQPEIFEVDFNAFLAQGPYFDFGVDFRTRFFYAEPWALQWIIDHDNGTRSLVPRAELLSALQNQSGPFRQQINVPVLLMQAENDELFVPGNDSALFSASPDVSYALLHNTGHKGFSHPTSHATAVSTVAHWLRSRF